MHSSIFGRRNEPLNSPSFLLGIRRFIIRELCAVHREKREIWNSNMNGHNANEAPLLSLSISLQRGRWCCTREFFPGNLNVNSRRTDNESSERATTRFDFTCYSFDLEYDLALIKEDEIRAIYRRTWRNCRLRRQCFDYSRRSFLRLSRSHCNKEHPWLIMMTNKTNFFFALNLIARTVIRTEL